jgi:hypothetical protein
MKKVLSLKDVGLIINTKDNFYQDVNGKMYELHFIMVLQMKLIDIITMINEGRLYYQSEC